MRRRITKRTVDALAPGSRDVLVWDTEIAGFGCKVTPKGARIFVLQYWHAGRARRVTLGRHGAGMTPDEARRKAETLRGVIAAGGDPAAARATARGVPTMEQFAERYLAEHAAAKKKPSSRAADERNLRNHILPALGRAKVDTITRGEIARFHSGLAGKPGAANRCLALLSKMMNI